MASEHRLQENGKEVPFKVFGMDTSEDKIYRYFFVLHILCD